MRGGGRIAQRSLQEYREEQAHRRAAIRLMFKQPDPGADAAAVATAGDDEGTLQLLQDLTAAVDMQQFRSMCESLHSKVPFREVVALYRDAYEIGGGGRDGGTGKGVVDFDRFLQPPTVTFFHSVYACRFRRCSWGECRADGFDMMRGRIGLLQLQLDGGE